MCVCVARSSFPFNFWRNGTIFNDISKRFCATKPKRALHGTNSDSFFPGNFGNFRCGEEFHVLTSPLLLWAWKDTHTFTFPVMLSDQFTPVKGPLEITAGNYLFRFFFLSLSGPITSKYAQRLSRWYDVLPIVFFLHFPCPWAWDRSLWLMFMSSWGLLTAGTLCVVFATG